MRCALDAPHQFVGTQSMLDHDDAESGFESAVTRPKRGKHGRYLPTNAQRERVMRFVGYGFTRPDIAKALGIDEGTLRKHFRHELDTGALEANAAVIGALYNAAVHKNSVPAQIYWTKARAGWRDNVDVTIHADQPTALHLVAAQLISDRLAAERGDAGAPATIDGQIVDDDVPPRE